MNRIERQIANAKQNKIEIVKSQPSANSLREGQEVIYIGRSNRLERYRKERGRLWVSYMDTDNNYTVERNLNVGNNINVNGTVYGNQIYIFTHSFDMDFGTSKVYLPWNATTENTAITTGFYDQLIAPYSGRLIKVMARPETASLTTIIGFHKRADTYADPNATATENITVEISAANTTAEFAFTSAASFDKGDTVALSFNPEADPNQAKISSVWSFKIII